ncbi:type VI secretion system protein TssA [Paraburkholderia sp. J8-2]|uniref:type VI secretion system protein TssA n=1 Tax=Paraburkholderia sp. J8-2 TaxID=2805440 RepID=UPI002AB71847|nr:type VI secretion system protein TssA [Paraburkholderia sp. J8-2]
MSSLSSLGKLPVTPAQPCGSDVRDEPEFELLQNEIGKLSNPSATSSVDWNRVSDLSTTLLANKGKDVLVASYLATSLLKTQGLTGFADGVQVVADLLQTYWDELYPPLQRMRARRNAMQWLIDRVKADGAERDWSSWPPQNPALLDDVRTALASIDRVLAEKDDDAPSMQPLRALVDTMQVAVEEPVAPQPIVAAAPPPAPEPEYKPAPTPLAAPAAAPAPALQAEALTPLAVDSIDSASRAIDEALDRLATIGSWYAQNQPSSAPGFRLRRVAAWTGIERAPAANGSETQLAGPIAPLQDALRGLLSRAAYADIVAFAETQILQYPFWLDLNHAAAMALAQLGDAWHSAHREVCNETAKFVARMEGIERLKFANGVPFANADTVEWLGTLTSSAGQTQTATAPDPLAAVLARARALAADNDLHAASQCLQDGIAQSTAVGTRLRLRTALCDLLLENRPGARLDAFARALVEEIDRYGAAAWEPELTADALRAAYAILSRNEQNEAETAALLARIAPLNAAIAVRLIT